MIILNHYISYYTYNIQNNRKGTKRPKKIDFYIPKKDENKDMMEPITKTEFLGLTIDTVNGSSDPRINKALSKGHKLLDIMEFIKITNFKLNMTMFDYFWQVVVGNVTGNHLNTSVLEWFGYEGEYKLQKQNFIKMLKRNNISFTELTQKDENIKLYPTIQEELQLIPSNVKHSKFLIMQPRDLKMAIMQLKTKNGHKIRQYYIDLEELLKLYVEYTLYFNHRESQRKIEGLEKMMADMTQYMKNLGIQLEDVRDQNDELLDNNKGLKREVKKVQRKLGIAVEDRAPLPAKEEQQERFVLIKRNDDEHYQYYTIRAQHGYTERRIKVQRTLFPQLEILLDFKAHPNSKTLYNRIKDELKAKNVTFDGNNIDIEDSIISEEELIDAMRVINDQKYDI